MVILVAGYDTTGSTLAYACYYLSKNPDAQEKLRNEIEDVQADPEKDFTYEEIQQMHYLDAVISETLRMYTPAPNLQRVANRDYKLPGKFQNVGASKSNNCGRKTLECKLSGA